MEIGYNAKNEMFVKVIKYSITPNGKKIITLHLHYPRIILSEVNTHRAFSRNSRSSRAVPVKTIIQEVIDKPFIPWHFGKNQKGMQASEECIEKVQIPIPEILDHWDDVVFSYVPYVAELLSPFDREEAWLWGRDRAVELAQGFEAAGYHKQVINRILEPYSWIDTLITTTDLSNFYHLRDHDDAEPHFHDLAKCIRQAVDNATPTLLEYGEWHLPFIEAKDLTETYDYVYSTQTAIPDSEQIVNYLIKLSVARSARISYAPFDGNGSIERELERYNLLVGSEPLHASPAEHQAQVDTQYDIMGGVHYVKPELSGNFGPGFIQYRKTLENECFFGNW